ncbi:MAG: trypsin-like peptidase domain-containing protein [Verrucomicrobiaceae bacterium]|nr:trypsin-like peptidase domain-containing protein [Verrucomicrobiaceae bacterium]
MALLGAQVAAADETEKLVEEWMKSVVKVTQLGRNGTEGLGAGWIVDESGLLVTNLHVIGRGRKLQVEARDGTRYEVTDVHAWDEHLDLAVLRVNAKGLKPLKIADVKTARPGHPVVAIGNPEGLEFSVVEGVVSATRDVDGIDMIQVALPIERGNSGGPLLNRKGEVLGVLTLKSMRTENLGFAMPASHVQRLLVDPNPVSMARWMTLGVLDEKVWQVIKGGADWTQRAGVIRSEGLGAGMGGRTVAISRLKPPTGAYEVSVKVKLADESGAAGLVFCSDGEDLHYGFYPSNGQMRLTRFEGPDVYSWTVLAQAPSSAYMPGEWNDLHVRLDAGKMTCWVNGELWREVEDSVLKGGSAGLCRFRNPQAEFKNFKVGSDLSRPVLDIKQTRAVREAIDGYVAGKTTLSLATGKLSGSEDSALNQIEEDMKSLNERIKALKRLGTSMHKDAVITQLAAHLDKPEGEISLLHSALLLARLDNPEVDPQPYLALVERMADELKNDAAIKKGGTSALKCLNKYLFHESGFHVSRHDMSDSNSYINEVLDDREGLPIMLCTLYLELGQRLGIQGLHGLGFPVKFMVGWKANNETAPTQIIDVAENGRFMTLEQVAKDIGFPDPEGLSEFLVPSTKKEMVLRMTRNLMGEIDDQSPPSEQQAGYLSLQIALMDHAPGERVLRAIYRSKNGDKSGARDDIRWLIQNTGDSIGEARLNELHTWYESLEEPATDEP